MAFIYEYKTILLGGKCRKLWPEYSNFRMFILDREARKGEGKKEEMNSWRLYTIAQEWKLSVSNGVSNLRGQARSFQNQAKALNEWQCLELQKKYAVTWIYNKGQYRKYFFMPSSLCFPSHMFSLSPTVQNDSTII